MTPTHEPRGWTLATGLALALCSTPLGAQDPPPESGKEPGDAVIATVGAQRILHGELLAELNRQIPLHYYHRKVPEGEMGRLRRVALEKLVEKSLVHQDALAQGITATEQEIREGLRATLKASEDHQQVSEREFEQLLVDYRPLIVRRLLLDKNEARFLAGLAKPDAARLAAAYEQIKLRDPELLMTPAEAHLQQIFIPVDPAAGAAVFEAKRTKIDEALKLLREGRPFAEVAKLYSEDDLAGQGGDLGVVTSGRFKSRTVNDAAFALQEGETSAVIHSLYGYHVLRCVKVMPRRTYTVDEVKPMLEEWFLTEHTRQSRETWLRELRQRYPVEVLAPELREPAAGERSEAGAPPRQAAGKGN